MVPRFRNNLVAETTWIRLASRPDARADNPGTFLIEPDVKKV